MNEQLKLGSLDGQRGEGGGQVYSVSRLVNLASRKLEASFGDVWVEGELSNLKSPASGHLYFTLKDRRAQLAVVMFRTAASRLRFNLEAGQKLRCRGRLGIYDAQGRFQLFAEVAEPAGVGSLQLAFEQLKQKLDKEGLFDRERKKPLPLLPRAIAVVTSPTGAAIRDIIRVLHNRCPVRVVVCPTPVQGSEAPAAIVQALHRADRLGVDLIIVGRGGGSLEDLWAFNHEGVARAIYSAQTPVISAVGHEVDITIADLVADRRAPTPSGAAELAVPVMHDLQKQLGLHRDRLVRSALHRHREGTLSLERLRRRLGSPAHLLNRSKMALDDATGALEAAISRELSNKRRVLHGLQSSLAAQEPRVRLGRNRTSLIAARGRLIAAARYEMSKRRSALSRLQACLDNLSPLAVLDRGYALVLDADGAVVREISRIGRGDALTLKLARGEVRCSVVSVTPAAVGKPEP